MNILITNDDGYNSPTLIALANKLSETHNITVVAPLEQQSGVSSALTFIRPLTKSLKNISDKFECYAVNGTPVDCVKLALSADVPKPDLVISGINQGRNTAINVLYSGTVGGAFEGAIAGIPSLAVSIDNHKAHHIDAAVLVTQKIIEKYYIGKTYSEVLILNINIPDVAISEMKGVRLTHIAPSIWADSYDKRIAPYGWEYFWFSGTFEYQEEDVLFDDGALRKGYVSISPMKIDFFNRTMFDELSTLNKKEH